MLTRAPGSHDRVAALMGAWTGNASKLEVAEAVWNVDYDPEAEADVVLFVQGDDLAALLARPLRDEGKVVETWSARTRRFGMLGEGVYVDLREEAQALAGEFCGLSIRPDLTFAPRMSRAMKKLPFTFGVDDHFAEKCAGLSDLYSRVPFLAEYTRAFGGGDSGAWAKRDLRGDYRPLHSEAARADYSDETLAMYCRVAGIEMITRESIEQAIADSRITGRIVHPFVDAVFAGQF
jgi:hypothetical protein